MYPSVPIGNRSIIVRGMRGGASNDLSLSVEVFPELTVTTTVTASGTVITAIIEANLDATFECQLDDLGFVPCM